MNEQLIIANEIEIFILLVEVHRSEVYILVHISILHLARKG